MILSKNAGAPRERKKPDLSKIFSSKNKKALALSGLFALVIAAGLINYSVTTGAFKPKTEVAAQSPAGEEDAFETFRQERQSVRAQELSYIESVSRSTETDAQTKAAAQAQKLALAENMEKELVAEGIIKTSMDIDAVVSVSSSLVSVVVAAEELSDEQVSRIVKIVEDQTDVSSKDVKIIPQAKQQAGSE